MSGACRFAGDLEAYVFGELPEARATAVLLHLAVCDECTEEVKLLRAERGAFRERAADVAEAVPSFAGVLERLERDPAPTRLVTTRDRWMIAGALAAAAGFAFFFTTTTHEPARQTGATPLIEASNESCFDGDPNANDQACASVDHVASNSARGDYQEAVFECAPDTEACEATSARATMCCEEQTTIPPSAMP